VVIIHYKLVILHTKPRAEWTAAVSTFNQVSKYICPASWTSPPIRVPPIGCVCLTSSPWRHRVANRLHAVPAWRDNTDTSFDAVQLSFVLAKPGTIAAWYDRYSMAFLFSGTFLFVSLTERHIPSIRDIRLDNFLDECICCIPRPLVGWTGSAKGTWNLKRLGGNRRIVQGLIHHECLDFRLQM
jgi:hypothetical protein